MAQQSDTVGRAAIGTLVGKHPDYTPVERDFGTAFVDVDEWREHPRPHRYVHGGFEGTHTLFSCYFPADENFDGRFFKYLEGGAGGHEDLLSGGGIGGMPMTWLFDLAYNELGAYLMESNQGHYHNEGLGFGNDVELFGASAESARFSKFLAHLIYARPVQHGYVFGPSGGGSRTIYCLENRPDVFDGGAPLVIGSGASTQQWSSWAYWWLHARQKLPAVIDAMEPGGSGDPYALLTTDEREALATLYRWGWPRRAETLLWAFGPWLFIQYQLMDTDPEYFSDFWTKLGHLGHDAPERLDRFLIDRPFKVKQVMTATQAMAMAGIVRAQTAGAVSTGPTSGKAATGASYGLILEDDLGDPLKFTMAKITVTSGRAKGREVYVSAVRDGVLFGFGERSPHLFDDVEPGDEVHVSNRDHIAFAHFHRYCLEADRHRVIDPANGTPAVDGWFGGVTHETVDTAPVPPQRELKHKAGEAHTGQFRVKMIHVNAAVDSMVWPASVAMYARKAREGLGPRADDHYRIWWIDNAPHGTPEILGPLTTSEKTPGVWASRMVGYDGGTAEALRSLIAWVEQGKPPLPSTNYGMTRDGGLHLPASAAERGGIQPVAVLRVNGAIRAEVKAGETVDFSATVDMPPGAGVVTRAEWDFQGNGAFVAVEHLPKDQASVEVQTRHAYAEPGVYFACLRVGGHSSAAQGRGPAVLNNARVRVVVST